MEHEFTPVIREILKNHFGTLSEEIFDRGYLLRYLNLKTKSAVRGSKSRGAFANNYAVYVLVEDYISKGFGHEEQVYSEYEGAIYTDLFTRMRELPFGSRLQNHALNSRMNEEFRKFFPDVPLQPIIRNLESKRYWINEQLLIIRVGEEKHNIAQAVIDIINAYIKAKRSAFDQFIAYSTQLALATEEDPSKSVSFIRQQLQPNTDARIFEIVSFAILKSHYADSVIYWGWRPEDLREEALSLYKTGRTNANDGGIDFVMKPLGRFFQVSETLDVKKYFLDIDKIQRYPISFVIKSELGIDEIYEKMQADARTFFSVTAVVQLYMKAIEEVINIPGLIEILDEQVQMGKVREILDEIVIQSKLEFNFD